MPLFLSAKQIDSNAAMAFADKFLNGKSNLRSSASELKLVYTAKANELRSAGDASENYYYVFNNGNNNGYVIIAADDVSVPIIAYSNTGNYNLKEQSPAHTSWMNTVKAGIAKAIADNNQPDKKVQEKWQKLRAGNLRAVTANPVVGPYLI